MPKLYSNSYSNIEKLETEINKMINCNPEIEINDMFKPSLMHYYNTDVQNW